MKELGSRIVAVGALILLATACDPSVGTDVPQSPDSPNGAVEVALPIDVGSLLNNECSDSCGSADSDVCRRCLVDECKKVAGDLAAMCDQLSEVPVGGDNTGVVIVDAECTDASDRDCAAQICDSLCRGDATCVAACRTQLQNGSDDQPTIGFVCVDECGRGGDAQCVACLKRECVDLCEQVPISTDERQRCRAACESIDSTHGNSGTCDGNTIAAPAGVTIAGFAYAGAGCPASSRDGAQLVLANGNSEVQLRLLAGTADITADASGESFDHAICMLAWSFANVPDGVCWSPGTTRQAGRAAVANSSASYRVRSEFAFGSENQTEATLSASGAFTAEVSQNNQVCSDQGGSNIAHHDTSVVARKGATIRIEHVQRIPIRWFACP